MRRRLALVTAGVSVLTVAAAGTAFAKQPLDATVTPPAATSAAGDTSATQDPHETRELPDVRLQPSSAPSIQAGNWLADALHWPTAQSDPAGPMGSAPRGVTPSGMPASVRAKAEAAMRFPNGHIPEALLCPSRSGWLMRCDAAWRFDQLDAAFTARFGRPIALIDAYRTFAGQLMSKSLYGFMAATPGTSNHGWGLAIDLTGPDGVSGTPQHTWLVTNAPRFGWWWPVWMRAGHEAFQLDEPWHFEYREGMDQEYIRIVSSQRHVDGPPPPDEQRVHRVTSPRPVVSYIVVPGKQGAPGLFGPGTAQPPVTNPSPARPAQTTPVQSPAKDTVTSPTSSSPAPGGSQAPVSPGTSASSGSTASTDPLSTSTSGTVTSSPASTATSTSASSTTSPSSSTTTSPTCPEPSPSSTSSTTSPTSGTGSPTTSPTCVTGTPSPSPSSSGTEAPAATATPSAS